MQAVVFSIIDNEKEITVTMPFHGSVKPIIVIDLYSNKAGQSKRC